MSSTLTHVSTSAHAQNPGICPSCRRAFGRSRRAKPAPGRRIPASNVIDVDSPSPLPELGARPPRSPSIICISSDSDADDNFLDADVMDLDSEGPSPFELPRPTPVDRGRALMLLLADLDERFPDHAFIELSDSFIRANIIYVRDLTEHDLRWLIETMGMEEDSAMLLMGAALSEHRPGRNGKGKGKGKGKSKL